MNLREVLAARKPKVGEPFYEVTERDDTPCVQAVTVEEVTAARVVTLTARTRMGQTILHGTYRRSDPALLLIHESPHEALEHYADYHINEADEALRTSAEHTRLAKAALGLRWGCRQAPLPDLRIPGE